MTREQKAELISAMTAEFKASEAVVVLDYKGMSVKQIEALRQNAATKEMKVRVLNNKLAMIALKNAGVEIALSETNIAIWGKEQISVCKVAVENAGKFDKLTVKGGVIAGEVADKAKVETYAKLPGREELLGMLLSTWMGPARYFVTAMDNLRKQKEEN